MDGVILAAYDIAVGSSGWRQLSGVLAEVLDARNLAIFLFDDRNGDFDLLSGTAASDPDRIGAYLAIARKMAARSGDASRPGERPCHHRAAGTASGRSVRWNSLSEPVAGGYLAGMAIGGAGDTPWLCVGVDIADPAGVEETHEKIERVLPHFCRAAGIDRHLRAAAERSAFSDTVFDRLPFGLMQLDHGATVVYANAEAERISRQRDGFAIASRKVRAGSSADDATLQSAIREAATSRKGSFSRWLSVKRGEGRPYRVLVTNVSDGHGDAERASRCVVFVTDPERPSMISPEAIADAFGLTTAEARVVARLTMGISLPDIAGNLKVSINTVRTLLARAMGKTATNTQVALVSMVLTNFSLVG